MMKGTTSECLVRFLSLVEPREKRAFTEFVGISPKGESVSRWASATQHPSGEKLLRIRHFLASRGYKVSELEKLDPVVIQAGFLVSHHFADLEEMAADIGLPGPRKREEMLKILLGQRGISESRRREIAAFVSLRHDKLPQTKQVVASKPASRFPVRPLSKTTEENPDGKQKVIKGLADMINSMLSFTELVLSDAFTAEEREKLRELTNGNGVFRLSNSLNRLCGERARREISSK